jgi:hypothetical protein
MQEAHGMGLMGLMGLSVDAKPEEQPREPRHVVLRVEIESKLELGPSDHRSSKPWGHEETTPSKRARTRRHHM